MHPTHAVAAPRGVIPGPRLRLSGITSVLIASHVSHFCFASLALAGVTNIVLAIAAFRALEAAKKDRNGERPSVWTENGDLDG